MGKMEEEEEGEEEKKKEARRWRNGRIPSNEMGEQRETGEVVNAIGEQGGASKS